MTQKKRVLFVSLGNICRSPVGEAVMRSLIEQRDLAHAFEVDSAGMIDDHAGQQPDPRMRQAAGRRGYRLAGRARRLTRRDLEQSDLVIVMDRDNLAALEPFDPYGRHRHKVHLMSEFLPDERVEEVPDPYYGRRRDFEAVVSLAEAAGERILEHALGGADDRGSELTA